MSEEDGDIEEDSEEFVISSDEEDEEDSSDENIGLKYQPSGPGMTFYNPVSATSQTIADVRTVVSDLAIFQGVPKNPNIKVRFVIGTREKNRGAGRGRGEIDAYKREWLKLNAMSRSLHWRRVFANSFEGDYYHKEMPFEIDGVRWKTVTHYLLGMLYINSPDYSILYSLNSSSNKNGWWGKVDSAIKEHRDNIRNNKFPPDLDYGKKIDRYLTIGLLAKFTQYPQLKQALLLTEDAMFAQRGGTETNVSDFPTLVTIREVIKKNPGFVFLGEKTKPREEKITSMGVLSPEELNYNYVDLSIITADKEERRELQLELVAGNVRPEMVYEHYPLQNIVDEWSPNSVIAIEPIVKCDFYVYIAVGAFRLNLETLMQNENVSFVKRHLYGIERIGDDKGSSIFVGVQRTPISQVSEYIHIEATLEGMSEPMEIYLEPLKSGGEFGIQIVSSAKDSRIVDYLKSLSSGSFVSPGELEDE